jgi:acetolactate synthase-1/2/3 large subunit
LQLAHFGLTYGTTFLGDTADPDLLPNYAEVARAYGATGIRIDSAENFGPALAKAIAMDHPVVLDVAMKNNPTPTTGHWNILDIYSPGEQRSHVTTD